MNIGALAVAEARRWIGTPYLHQASVCGAGTDCLGLLRGVWRAVHGDEPQAVPPYTADWAEPSRSEVLLEAARRWLLEIDRAKAIRSAIASARAGDVVVLAGKGHETYQEIAGEKRPFSDAAEAGAALSQWSEP